MHPRNLCTSASVKLSTMKSADNLLVFGAVTAQPVENRLTRSIRNPPSSRRAYYVVRWSEIIHRYPPLLRKCAGDPLTAARSVRSL